MVIRTQPWRASDLGRTSTLTTVTSHQRSASWPTYSTTKEGGDTAYGYSAPPRKPPPGLPLS